jgi:predicted nuclease with TOPRIM domain
MLKEQKRIKDKYRAKYEAEREKLAKFAAAQHHLNDKLVQALARVDELEYENAELREQLAKLKRSTVVSIE